MLCFVTKPILSNSVSLKFFIQSVSRPVTLKKLSCFCVYNILSLKKPQILLYHSIRHYSVDNVTNNKQSNIRRNIGRFKISMSQEEKDRKLKKIEEMRIEEAPSGLFAKVKYYVKRYWYIALPVHATCCTLYLGGIYFAIKSGVDVIGLLKTLNLPDSLVEKVKQTPPTAGVLICTPLRYATTLAGIQVAFWTLRRLGKLKTVREVEFGVRSGFENKYINTIRKLNERRNRSSLAKVLTPSAQIKVVPRRKNLTNNCSDGDDNKLK